MCLGKQYNIKSVGNDSNSTVMIACTTTNFPLSEQGVVIWCNQRASMLCKDAF